MPARPVGFRFDSPYDPLPKDSLRFGSRRAGETTLRRLENFRQRFPAASDKKRCGVLPPACPSGAAPGGDCGPKSFGRCGKAF